MKEDTVCLMICLIVLAASSLAGLAPQEPATQPADRPLTIEEIVNKTNYVSYYQGADGRARVLMTITDSQNRTRAREFTILRCDQPKPQADAEDQPPTQPAESPTCDQFTGEQKSYIYFHRPADVSRMVFLVWKHLEKDDDRWLYLPALDLVKRIASADKRTSFVGSDFFYEDVSGRNVNDDVHEIVPDQTNETYYVLKNTPKDPDGVEFAYFKTWIHRESFVVVQTSYYDKDDQESRRYNALRVDTIQGFPTVTQSQMTNFRTGGKTVLEYSDVAYDIGIPEEVFTERYLRRAPQEYLR